MLLLGLVLVEKIEETAASSVWTGPRVDAAAPRGQFLAGKNNA